MALYGDVTYDSRVRKEARSLSQAGYDVAIVCLAGAATASDLPENVRVLVRQPGRGAVIPGASNPFVGSAGVGGRGGRVGKVVRRAGWLLGYIRSLRGWGQQAVAAAGPVDIWHANDLTGLAAIAPHVPKGIPIVYDSHELFLEAATASRLPGPLRRLLRRYERHLVARTSGVITVNDEIAHVLQRRYHPRRIAVVHNCPERWIAPTHRLPLLREAARIPVGAPIILYHGMLSAQRGIERLMDALLEPRLEEAHLVLMGFGDRRDEYIEMARADRLRGRAHVLDAVPPDELLTWVASADVGAIPIPRGGMSYYFSTPNKLFECLAAGVPVVASEFPPMRRIVMGDPERPLGALCDPSRVDSIAHALDSILRLSPPAADALRARCAAAAAQRWNWQAESLSLIQLYTDILATPA
jgi:glycosyltransferase involved in cell wall biosynthesis